ncbi:MAG: hypothetical protein JKY49_05940 [Cohaesibacteraceae bacterium]|nr:hypothetical protein [Cohaesibacteraceae bacterium]MBL4874894.1 hypothetical protein [Cohaesibacteraceae bacterium]
MSKENKPELSAEGDSPGKIVEKGHGDRLGAAPVLPKTSSPAPGLPKDTISPASNNGAEAPVKKQTEAVPDQSTSRSASAPSAPAETPGIPAGQVNYPANSGVPVNITFDGSSAGDSQLIDAKVGEASEKIRREMGIAFAELMGSIKETNADLRSELRETTQAIRVELRENNNALRTELRETTQSSRGEMRDTSSAIRTEMRESSEAIRGSTAESNATLGGNFNEVATAIQGEMRQTAEFVRHELKEMSDEFEALKEHKFRQEEENINAALLVRTQKWHVVGVMVLLSSLVFGVFSWAQGWLPTGFAYDNSKVETVATPVVIRPAVVAKPVTVQPVVTSAPIKTPVSGTSANIVTPVSAVDTPSQAANSQQSGTVQQPQTPVQIDDQPVDEPLTSEPFGPLE